MVKAPRTRPGRCDGPGAKSGRSLGSRPCEPGAVSAGSRWSVLIASSRRGGRPAVPGWPRSRVVMASWAVRRDRSSADRSSLRGASWPWEKTAAVGSSQASDARTGTGRTLASSRARYGRPSPTVRSPKAVGVPCCSNPPRNVSAQDRAPASATRSVRVTSRARSAAYTSGSGEPSRPRRPASTITSCPRVSRLLNASASGSHREVRERAWPWARVPGISVALESGMRIVTDGIDSTSVPSRCAKARSIRESVGAARPRKYPASTADPPVGSASTSSAGRRHVKASANAVVVTPGDPEAEVNTISAIALSAPASPAPARPCRWRRAPRARRRRPRGPGPTRRSARSRR